MNTFTVHSDRSVTETCIYDADGKLFRRIELINIFHSDYHQTVVYDADGYVLVWYDNQGEYQSFNNYFVLNKKGEPVHESDIISSTIHQIWQRVKYSLKGFEKLKRHKYMPRMGEKY